MGRSKAQRTLEDHRSMLASMNPKNYNVERWAFVLHRITGVIIALYFFAHIYVTGQVIYGREAWEKVMSVMANPVGHLGELVVLAAVVLHSLNGIRLFLIWRGFLVGRPGRPEFPYKATFLGRNQRLSVWLMVIFSILLVLYGGYQILVL